MHSDRREISSDNYIQVRENTARMSTLRVVYSFETETRMRRKKEREGVVTHFLFSVERVNDEANFASGITFTSAHRLSLFNIFQ